MGMNASKTFGWLAISALTLSLVLSSNAMADGVAGVTEGAVDPKASASSAASEPKQAPQPPEMTIERAQGETLAAATGHYARARSLLVSAIREFDQGYKIAKPDVILDSAKWRDDLINRAKDLEKLLAPQPRITKGGVKFNADPRLLNPEAKPK
jgi:hypothetical protein